jgi:hypothetical protein
MTATNNTQSTDEHVTVDLEACAHRGTIMSETQAPPKKEVFRDAESLQTPEFECHNTIAGDEYMVIEGGPRWRRSELRVRHARKLRDWLNKALPADETRAANTDRQRPDWIEQHRSPSIFSRFKDQ